MPGKKERLQTATKIVMQKGREVGSRLSLLPRGELVVITRRTVRPIIWGFGGLDPTTVSSLKDFAVSRSNQRVDRKRSTTH